MPTSWRITKTAHTATAFDGEGARLYGGRWNSRNIAVVYTAASESLALLELLVHLQSTSVLLESYSTIAVSFDDDLVETVDRRALPKAWRSSPAPSEVQQIGDHWAGRAGSPVLAVPSAIVPSELNYLLNPAHPKFTKLRIAKPTSIEIDPRLY